MNPTNNENNSTLEAWLPYAGELVAVASAMRTASTISRRYDLSNGGMKGAATELFASWFLPSVAARSVVSYVPEALPYSKAVKGLLSILTALGIASKLNPKVCYLLQCRYKMTNWGALGKVAAVSSSFVHALTGKKML